MSIRKLRAQLKTEREKFGALMMERTSDKQVLDAAHATIARQHLDFGRKIHIGQEIGKVASRLVTDVQSVKYASADATTRMLLEGVEARVRVLDDLCQAAFREPSHACGRIEQPQSASTGPTSESRSSSETSTRTQGSSPSSPRRSRGSRKGSGGTS